MTGCGDQELLLCALLDGELDAVNALALERHLEGCAACRAEQSRLKALRLMIAAGEAVFAAPESLRRRILLDTGAEAGPAAGAAAAAPRGPLGLARVASLAAALVAVAATLILAVVALAPRAATVSTQDQLVTSHVRSLLTGHVTDVLNSDRHVVKPWFNGHIDFAPPVVDLADAGFPLTGGRLDYVDGRVVAVIVYHRRLHPIDLFVRPARAAVPVDVAAHREGYNLVCWTREDLGFCAVSDLNAKELRQFAALFAARAAG